MTLRSVGAVFVLIVLAGCGGDGSAACGGLDCMGIGGTSQAEEPCGAARPCAPGHVCMEDGECSEQCDDGICKHDLGDRAECDSSVGECAEVSDCGRTVLCNSSQDVCDGTSHTCFPDTGKCKTTDDCPYMFSGAHDFGLHCESLFCRFPPPPLGQLSDTPGGLQVDYPLRGTSFGSQEKFRVELTGPAALYVAVVIEREPRLLDDLKQACWVASSAQPGNIQWGAGTQLVDPSGTGCMLQGKPLYLVVLRYDAGRLAATSPTIPFIIGEDWPRPFTTACEQPGVVGESCSNPERLQACAADNLCGIVCASDRDCLASITAGKCDDPDATGIRFCLHK